MRGRGQDEDFEAFLAARSQDLHHDACQLTAAQEPAEQLVATVLAEMRRDRTDLSRAGAEARLRMARAAARNATPTVTDRTQMPQQFHVLARLSPRQRAVLVLQVVDNYDARETARALRLSTRAVTETLQSIPYDELPGASPHTGELRSLLDDFGDAAIPPSASTTLADVDAVPPPPRRPWWTYVAAFLVIALTVATVGITQRWHNDWLKTPDGLNHAHGTHFPAYTQGYKLVGIRDVAPGAAQALRPPTQGAIAVECSSKQPDQSTIGRLFGPVTGNSQAVCSARGKRQVLTPAIGATDLAIDDFSRDEWPVAVYQHLAWAQYPVARTGFVVEHDETLAGLRPTDDSGEPIRPVTGGKILTLHGTADHPNGTFTGTLETPAGDTNSLPVFLGLLTPTTTGQFALVVGSEAPMTNCGAPGPVFYTAQNETTTCSLVDRQVPQVEYSTWAEFQATGKSMTVRFTVKHARGPWTLQLVYDIYRDNNGVIVSP